jgi:hypothetical protein
MSANGLPHFSKTTTHETRTRATEDGPPSSVFFAGQCCPKTPRTQSSPRWHADALGATPPGSLDWVPLANRIDSGMEGESMDPKLRQSYEEFLNPDVMRPRLIAASVYIAGYESLKDSIVDRIRGFFWTGFDATGDRIDPKYQTDVLSRNKSPVYASLDWLKSMNAINDADIEAFNRVKTCRNILVHNLFSRLGSDGMPPDFEKCFEEMASLLHKIELWWIREVEMPTDPDFDGKEIPDSEIAPGRIIGLQLLCEIALGDPQSSRRFLDEFRKKANEQHRR